MSEIGISQVLGEMRALAARAAAGASPAAEGAMAPGGSPAVAFQDLLKTSIDKVSALQQDSARLATAFETGDPQVDLAQVMVSVQKSRVAFEAMVQVRNKLVKAYQDIMSMSV